MQLLESTFTLATHHAYPRLVKHCMATNSRLDSAAKVPINVWLLHASEHALH